MVAIYYNLFIVKVKIFLQWCKVWNWTNMSSSFKNILSNLLKHFLLSLESRNKTLNTFKINVFLKIALLPIIYLKNGWIDLRTIMNTFVLFVLLLLFWHLFVKNQNWYKFYIHN